MDWEAIAILNGEKFDMVLTDYYMPGMNGLELIRWVRETRTVQTVTCYRTDNRKSAGCYSSGEKCRSNGLDP